MNEHAILAESFARTIAKALAPLLRLDFDPAVEYIVRRKPGGCVRYEYLLHAGCNAVELCSCDADELFACAADMLDTSKAVLGTVQ